MGGCPDSYLGVPKLGTDIYTQRQRDRIFPQQEMHNRFDILYNAALSSIIAILPS
jgi:hypothetical protein